MYALPIVRYLFLMIPNYDVALAISSKGTYMYIFAHRPLKAAEVQVSILNSDPNFLLILH